MMSIWRRLFGNSAEPKAGASLPLIRINHDDYLAQHIGKLSDGRQFFLTEPFIPAGDTPGREFLALFLFDSTGQFQEARIEDLGVRGQFEINDALAMRARWLDELGRKEFCRIEVRPFAVTRFGTTFGLITSELEDGEAPGMVTLEPGSFMAFFPPYEGDYDT